MGNCYQCKSRKRKSIISNESLNHSGKSIIKHKTTKSIENPKNNNKNEEENFICGKEFSKMYKNICSLLDKEFIIPINIDISKIKSKNIIRRSHRNSKNKISRNIL